MDDRDERGERGECGECGDDGDDPPWWRADSGESRGIP